MPLLRWNWRVGFSGVAVLLAGVIAPAGQAAGSEPIALVREALFGIAPQIGNESNRFVRLQTLSEAARLIRSSTSFLIRNLEDESPAVRGMAAVALGNLGPAAGEAVPILIKIFPEQDNEVKSYIAAAFGKIGSPAGEAVPLLIEELEKAKAPARGYRGNLVTSIIRAIGELRDPVAIPILVELLYDESEDYSRIHASEALARIGEPAIAALIEALPRDSAAYRQAAQALGKIGAPAIPALGEALTTGSRATKEGAIVALERARNQAQTPAADLLPLLIEALDDPEVRLNAAKAIGSIGPETGEAVPALIEMLRESAPESRQAAAMALGSFGHLAKPAVLELISLLDAPEAETRANAASALRIGPVAPEAVPRLIELLDDPEAEVRISATHSLAHFGTLATPAVPRLIALLGDENSRMVTGARMTLSGHGTVIPGIGPAAVEPLLEALQDERAQVRYQAVIALGRLGTLAEQGIPNLEAALGDEDPKVREYAAWALGQIGPAAKSAVPGLIRMLQDEHLRGREKAAESLGQIEASTAVPALVEAIDRALGRRRSDDTEEQRQRRSFLWQALKALDALRPAAEPVVPVLRRVVESEERDFIRADAALALARVRPGESLPLVLEFLDNQSIPTQLTFLEMIRSTYLFPPRELIGRLRTMAIEGYGAARIGAAETLAHWSSERPSALGMLVAALDSDGSAIQWLAAEALGRLKTDAASTVPFLIPLIDSRDLSVRYRVVNALRMIRDPRAVEPLLKAVRNRSEPDSVRAAWAVLAIDPSMEEAWEALAAGVRSENPAVRATVLEAYDDLNASKAVPNLRQAVTDPHPRLAHQARRVLDRLEPDAF